jgi:serine/threonine protein kinase
MKKHPTDITRKKTPHKTNQTEHYEGLIGNALDAYVIDGVLGVGGQAVVFLCHGKDLKNLKYAVKVFGLNGADHKALEKGLAEAKIQSRVEHPAVVKVFQPGIAELELHGEVLSVLFIPMELSTKGNCEDSVPFKDRQLEPTDLSALIQLFEGLKEIHTMMLHRDIKPANILHFSGTVPLKITDFGIATERIAIGGTQGDSGLTPSYMAPEQLNQDDTPFMDIYSMGATLYYMLTGQDPIPEPDDRNDLYAWQKVHNDHIRPNPMDLNPHCSPGLALLVRRMMSVEKNERPTIEECIIELKELIRIFESKILKFDLPSEIESQFSLSKYQLRYTPKFNRIFAPAIHILCGTKLFVIRMQMGHPIFSQYKRLINLVVEWYSDCFSMYETYGPYDIHLFIWSDDERIQLLFNELVDNFIDSQIKLYSAASNVIHLHDEENHRGPRTIVGALAVQEQLELKEINSQHYLLPNSYPTDTPEKSIRAFIYVNAVPKGGSINFSIVRAAIIQNVREVLDNLIEIYDKHEGLSRRRFPRLTMITLENTKEIDEPVVLINFVASEYKHIHQIATEIIERGGNAVKTSTFLETGRILIQSDKILF